MIFWKNLKNKNTISEETYKKLRPVRSKPGILYGSAKVLKHHINGLPPFKPILSAIGTPTYKHSVWYNTKWVYC